MTQVLPPLRWVDRLPLTRDQLMLLMAAVNELFLATDIYLAHSLNGSIARSEWIPIIFGTAAGIILLLAGLIALRNRPAATILANLVFLASIVVGVMGIYFHLSRTVLLAVPAQGQQFTVSALIWAPPFLGPAVFILVSALGISAAWIEEPPNSGRLRLLRNRHIQLPYSKTRAYFLIVGMFALVTVISSVLDHARSQLENPWVWLPLIAGIFALAVAITLGMSLRPSQLDLITYLTAMLMLIVVGLIGAVLHLNTNLTPGGVIVIERFLRGSPVLAPMLFANVGLLGLIVLLNPREQANYSNDIAE